MDKNTCSILVNPSLKIVALKSFDGDDGIVPLYLPEKKQTGAVERLSLEEELAFINQAYEESGRTGLMMKTLLETGCRVSEFIELRVEDVYFNERLIIIQKGKEGKRREVPIR